MQQVGPQPLQFSVASDKQAQNWPAMTLWALIQVEPEDQRLLAVLLGPHKQACNQQTECAAGYPVVLERRSDFEQR